MTTIVAIFGVCWCWEKGGGGLMIDFGVDNGGVIHGVYTAYDSLLSAQ